MTSQIIYECQAFCPTLERAKRRVPEEFIPCYDWFQRNTDETISRLPHRMESRPQTPIPRRLPRLIQEGKEVRPFRTLQRRRSLQRP